MNEYRKIRHFLRDGEEEMEIAEPRLGLMDDFYHSYQYSRDEYTPLPLIEFYWHPKALKQECITINGRVEFVVWSQSGYDIPAKIKRGKK